jgi:hypothetical protein
MLGALKLAQFKPKGKVHAKQHKRLKRKMVGLTDIPHRIAGIY